MAAGRVDLVHLVCLVHLVGLVQPNKPDKPNKPNEAPRSKLRGILRNSPKPLPSFAKAMEGSPRSACSAEAAALAAKAGHPRSKLRGIRRWRITNEYLPYKRNRVPTHRRPIHPSHRCWARSRRGKILSGMSPRSMVGSQRPISHLPPES